MKKHDENAIKQNTKNKKKSKISDFILVIISDFFYTIVFGSIIIPMISNFEIASWWIKLLMILSSLLGCGSIGYLYIFVRINLKEKIRNSKDKVQEKKYKDDLKENSKIFIPIILCCFLSIIYYVNFNFFGLRPYVDIFILFILFAQVLYGIISQFSNEIFVRIFLVITILTFCFALLLSDNIEYGPITLKIAVGFLVFYLLACAINNYILGEKTSNSNKKNLGKITTIIWNLIAILILIFGIPFYLRWWDISETILYSIIIPIYASALTGALTLCGVILTIDKQEKYRKVENMEKSKPYLQKRFNKDFHPCDFLKLKIDNNQVSNSKYICFFSLDFYVLHNPTIFIGCEIDGLFYEFYTKAFIEENTALILSEKIKSDNEIQIFHIICKDMLGNFYSYKCNLTSKNGKSSQEIDATGEKYNFYEIIYNLDYIELPEVWEGKNAEKMKSIKNI